MIDDTNKENETTEESAEQAPSLTVNDLANIKQIIDVASSRGAFRANEYQVIGATYDRLSAFLQSVLPTPEETEEETEK